MHKILLITIVVLIFAGCSKSNSNNKSSTYSLTGKWIYTADTLREYDNGTLTTTTPFLVNSSDYFQFNDNGGGSTNNSPDTAIITNYNYKLSGSTITFNFDSIVINGFTEPGYTQNATIKQLTTDKLTIFFDDTEEVNGISNRTTEIVYMTKQ